MRIVTTIFSLVLATATIGGCSARARVRVADTTPATSSKATSKVAADDASKSPAVKGEGQGGAEAPAAPGDTNADPEGVPSHN